MKFEIFSAIKFIKFDDLVDILVKQYDENSNRKLLITNEDKKWLIEIVISQNLLSFQHAVGIHKSKPSNILRNAIYILSLVDLTIDEVEVILDCTSTMVKDSTAFIKNDSQKITGAFIRNQNFTNDNSITAEILTTIINEHLQTLLENTAELKYLRYNSYKSVYSHAIDKAVKIDDKKTIDALLKTISNYSIFEQTMISRCLLFLLAEVSDDVLKRNILDFIVNIPLKELGEGSFLLYSLDLVAHDLKQMEDDFINRLENHLTELENGDSLVFDVHDFARKLDFIYQDNAIKEYKNASEIAHRLSEKWNNTMSNFSLG